MLSDVEGNWINVLLCSRLALKAQNWRYTTFSKYFLEDIPEIREIRLQMPLLTVLNKIGLFGIFLEASSLTNYFELTDHHENVKIYFYINAQIIRIMVRRPRKLMISRFFLFAIREESNFSLLLHEIHPALCTVISRLAL